MTDAVLTDAARHAEEDYPLESCGYVTTDDEYVRVRNAHDHPDKSYEIDDEDYGRAYAAGRVAAVVHSHPEGPEYPSAGDMLSQTEVEVPYIIVPVFKYDVDEESNVRASVPFVLEPEEPPELIGRPFRHGVTDCYTLIRDWYRVERDVVLPSHPREWAWWTVKDGDLYDDYFAEAGFRVLRGGEEPGPGDVFLASIKSKKINHGGIYIGDGKILHHATRDGRPYDPTSLSARESVHRWAASNLFRKWVRYDPEAAA